MKKRYKKGGFLLEIFIGIVILGAFAIWTFQTDASKREQQNIEEAIDKVSVLVSYGIYDIFKGYTTSGGGNCSSGYDVKDISAKRIKLCTDIPFELIDEPGGDDKDGSKSFFTFLDNYSKDERGCKVYVDDYDDFTTRLLIDCSGMEERTYDMLEQKFAKRLANQLALIYKASYPNAIDFTDLNSGTETDGILILEFQK